MTCRRAGTLLEGRVFSMPWRLEGTYFENCNCDMACPCTTSGLTRRVIMTDAMSRWLSMWTQGTLTVSM